MPSTSVARVALIGARGHTGAELIKLLDVHPGFELVAVSSRALSGQRLDAHVTGINSELIFRKLTPGDVARFEVDVWVLALPNGLSEPWVQAIDAYRPSSVIIDLSSDHRFDRDWTYGLPELNRDHILGSRRIANPGCYATGAEIALKPLVSGGYLKGTAHVFGVSGYSGAGTTPSPKNDPDQLHENIMPYRLCGHNHELEIRWQLGAKVVFMPHVASWFRGITLTVSTHLKMAMSRNEALDIFRSEYAFEPLISVRDEQDPPLVRDAVGKHGLSLGGFTVDATEKRLVCVATLDNLLKGAATQALQNMNLTTGQDELAGIRALI